MTGHGGPDQDLDLRVSDARAGVEWLARMERSDFPLEERLGLILRFGVRASSACLAVGLLLSLITGLSVVGDGLMVAGLVLLMATPIARVAASVVEYAQRRDWPFFTFTLIVFCELSAGIVAALLFHRRL